jgi:predicted transporter
MVLEARRLGMRRVWLYLLFGILVAISVTVPIFLINRERALAAREPSSAGGTLGMFDVVGLVLVTAAILVYAAIALLRG